MKRDVIALLTFLFIMVTASSAVAVECWSYDGNQSGCQAQADCEWEFESFAPGPDFGWCEKPGCWELTNQTGCEATTSTLGCTWNTDSWGSWCEEFNCYAADNTNETYCATTLNESYSMECVWTNSSSLCDPIGGQFSCSDYDGNENGCYNTYFCEWDGANCNEPSGGFYGSNPSCGVIGNQGDCENVTGCSCTNRYRREF